MAITVSRLGLAYDLMKRINDGRNTAIPTAGIVAADILDGVIARNLDADTPARRAADGFVDRVTMGMAFLAAAKKYPSTRPFISILAARELTVGLGNTINGLRNKEAIRGGGLHKLGTLSIAAFGIAITSQNRRAEQIGGTVASALNLALAADYWKAWRQPELGEKSGGVRVIPAFNAHSRHEQIGVTTRNNPAAR